MSVRDLLLPGCALYIAGHADLMRALGTRMTDERAERVAERMADLLVHRLENERPGILGEPEIVEAFQRAMQEVA